MRGQDAQCACLYAEGVSTNTSCKIALAIPRYTQSDHNRQFQRTNEAQHGPEINESRIKIWIVPERKSTKKQRALALVAT